MSYVDGYVLAVPTDARDAYRALAADAAQVFKEHGALSVVECWGDDVPAGVLTSLPMAVKAEPHETVVFAWIRWPDRAARDAGNAAVHADPRMRSAGAPLFDSKRMIFGGFAVLLEA